jgi:hypothetical protein
MRLAARARFAAVGYTQRPDAFCIASSDADFTPLVMQLKANGHEVYGFGELKTPLPFVNACTRFLHLATLTAVDPAHVVATTSETKIATASKPSSGGGPSKPAVNRKTVPLAEDLALVTILRGAVEAAIQDDGWAPSAAAGSAAKRQASIDPRNYGMKVFPALFAVIGLFDIVEAENGQGYVVERRNGDRAATPSRVAPTPPGA